VTTAATVAAVLVRTRPGLDLVATLGALGSGSRDPTIQLRPATAWWATRTPDGPGTLHLSQAGDTVTAEAWGPGRDWLLAGVPALIGEHDDDSTFVAHHPVVADARARQPGLRIGRSQRVVHHLFASILAQRVTSIEAARQWRTLCRIASEPAPGPAPLRLPPDPAVLAGMPYWWFHRFGIERRRADTLRRVAVLADRLDAMAGPAPMSTIPGVGPWTVAHVAATGFGDADAVPVGDYHLAHIVAYALAGERRGTDDLMLELLEPYRGHRGRVLRLLIRAGVGPPRRAPRQAIMPIASW
jgi:3-methyladenine DNA glycosylase/8-oxoguanine DNA glycosylase